MEEHQSNLNKNGYTTFTSSNNPLNKTVIQELNNIFQSKSISNGSPHSMAYNTTIGCYRKIKEDCIKYKEFQSNFDDNEIQYIINNLIEPVMDLFPKGSLNTKRFIKILFVDDTRVVIEDSEELVKNYDGPIISQHIAKALVWHKDIFTLDEPYRYLFFTVTYQYGIEDHMLELGNVEKNNLGFKDNKDNRAMHVTNEKDVKILCRLHSEEGTGYAIDQLYDIVHKNTGFKTYISNFDIKQCDYINVVKQENLKIFKNIPTNNNIKSQDYKTPKRYKFILRCSDDIRLIK